METNETVIAVTERCLLCRENTFPLFSCAPAFGKIRKAFVKIFLVWSLVTPPAIAQSLFAAIGDYGNGSAIEGSVAGMVHSWNPDFIITMGDNRYTSVFDETVGQFYCDYLADTGSGSLCSGNQATVNAFFPSLGNHDYNDGGRLDEYLDYFTLPGSGIASSHTSGTERYYDFIIGSVHFFVLDSQQAISSPVDNTAQRNWLKTQLEASRSPWQLVYFHHPPFSSARHGSSTAMQWPFASWGADAVISGHDHTYERISVDGIVYFVNGLGGRSIYNFNAPVPGSQVRYNGDYGAMRISASETTITFEFINRSGGIIDTYTLTAGATGVGTTGDGGSGGGGCTTQSIETMDPVWLFFLVAAGIAYFRRHVISGKKKG